VDITNLTNKSILLAQRKWYWDRDGNHRHASQDTRMTTLENQDVTNIIKTHQRVVPTGQQTTDKNHANTSTLNAD